MCHRARRLLPLPSRRTRDIREDVRRIFARDAFSWVRRALFSKETAQEKINTAQTTTVLPVCCGTATASSSFFVFESGRVVSRPFIVQSVMQI